MLTALLILLYYIYQVPLGVLFYNETKVDEMCYIMESLQQYVPVKPCTVTESLPNGEELTYNDFHVHPILMRDLLTVLRANGAQMLRNNHENKIDCLQGLMAFAEDWHTRQSLLRVRQFYKICLITYKY